MPSVFYSLTDISEIFRVLVKRQSLQKHREPIPGTAVCWIASSGCLQRPVRGDDLFYRLHPLEQRRLVSTYRDMQPSLDLAPVLARRLTVLGSTGSVGAATLDVVRFARSHYGADAFPLEVITAHRNAERLVHDARELKPRTVVIGDASLLGEVKSGLARSGIEILAAPRRSWKPPPSRRYGHECDRGSRGAGPTLAALQRGAMVALANKECVVAAGAVFHRAAAASKGS